MNEKALFYAIGGIDEKWIAKAEPDAYGKNEIKKRKKYRGIISLAACLAVLVCSAFLAKSGVLKDILHRENNIQTTLPAVGETEIAPETEIALWTEPLSGGETTAASSSSAVTVNPPETENMPTADDGIVEVTSQGYNPDAAVTSPDYDKSTGGAFVPALPGDKKIVSTGEKITDEEASAYLKENYNSIVSALSASGVKTSKPKFSEKGFSYVSYDGTEGESLTVRENFRDYLLFDGDEIISIVTLHKENGKIYNTPAFGGLWFKSFGEYLNKHKGEELVFVFAGMAEFIIAPDNTVCSPLGYETGAYFEGISKPYEIFYHPSAVYVP